VLIPSTGHRSPNGAGKKIWGFHVAESEQWIIWDEGPRASYRRGGKIYQVPVRRLGDRGEPLGLRLLLLVGYCRGYWSLFLVSLGETVTNRPLVWVCVGRLPQTWCLRLGCHKREIIMVGYLERVKG